MKSFVAILLVMVALGTTSSAQLAKGDNQVDARLGLSSASSVFNFGVDYDWVWKKAGEFGPGALTAGASIDFSSYSYKSGVYTFSRTWIPIGGHVGYHFGPMMTDKQWDPFFNIGLLYLIDHAQNDALSSNTINGNGFYMQFIAGVNYYFSPRWFALATIGMNSSWLSAGVGYRL